MREYRWDMKDLIGGLSIMLIGLLFFVGALALPMGTPRRLGPGVYPLLLAGITILFGAILAIRSLARSGSFPAVEWRAAAGVLAAIGVFFLGFRYLGLMPAVFGAIIVGSLADRNVNIVRSMLLGAAVAVLAWLVFHLGLGLPMPAFRGWF